MFRPGDLVRIETRDHTLEVIAVDGKSPYVKFDWDWPMCPLDYDEDDDTDWMYG